MAKDLFEDHPQSFIDYLKSVDMSNPVYRAFSADSYERQPEPVRHSYADDLDKAMGIGQQAPINYRQQNMAEQAARTAEADRLRLSRENMTGMTGDVLNRLSGAREGVASSLADVFGKGE